MVATSVKLAVYQGQLHQMTFERSLSANWVCPHAQAHGTQHEVLLG